MLERRTMICGLGAATLAGARLGDLRPQALSERDDSGRSATIAEAAAMTFDPWEMDPEFLPSNEEWMAARHSHLIMVRIAYAINCKTKEQVMADFARMDTVLTEEFFDDLRSTRRFFEGLATVASTCEARIVCAGVALTMGKGAA